MLGFLFLCRSSRRAGPGEERLTLGELSLRTNECRLLEEEGQARGYVTTLGVSSGFGFLLSSSLTF